MITYTEKGEITTKTECAEHDMIGWSLLDASKVYRATVTQFSIAQGVIACHTKIINADGSDYRPRCYRNVYNGFTEV